MYSVQQFRLHVLVVGCMALLMGLIIAISMDRKAINSPPFTPGLYENAVSGKISSMGSNKTRVLVRIRPANILYEFTPLRTDAPSFQEVVRTGDSLWKPANSDSIYVRGKKSKKLHGYRFETR